MIGTLEEAIVDKTILEEESTSGRGDFSSIRQIVFEQSMSQSPASVEMPQKTKEECLVPDHLQDLLKRSTAGRDNEEKAAITQLFHEYQDVFLKDKFDLGRTHLVEHHIETRNARPIKLPPRQIPFASAAEDQKELEKLTKQGVIQPSISPWAAPLVMVRKSDGSARMCIDYR